MENIVRNVSFAQTLHRIYQIAFDVCEEIQFTIVIILITIIVVHDYYYCIY